MKKFQQNVGRELKRAYPDRRKLEAQVEITVHLHNIVKLETQVQLTVHLHIIVKLEAQLQITVHLHNIV